MSLEELKQLAESFGFELTEKKREIKVGDFGKFWDDGSKTYHLGFLESINEGEIFEYEKKDGSPYKNFAHLTEKEKENIKANW